MSAVCGYCENFSGEIFGKNDWGKCAIVDIIVVKTMCHAFRKGAIEKMSVKADNIACQKFVQRRVK